MIVVGNFLFTGSAQASSLSEINIIELTNKERVKTGASELTRNYLLDKAAKNKAQAIFDTQIFAHTIGQKKFSEWIKDTGYDYSYVGENLAIEFITSEGTIKAWLDSPTHKKNLLNPEFKEIGVAVERSLFNGKETTLVVQILGVRDENKENLTISNKHNSYTKMFSENKKEQLFVPFNYLNYKYDFNSKINYLDHSFASTNKNSYYSESLILKNRIKQIIIQPFFSLLKNKGQLLSRV